MRRFMGTKYRQSTTGCERHAANDAHLPASTLGLFNLKFTFSLNSRNFTCFQFLGAPSREGTQAFRMGKFSKERVSRIFSPSWHFSVIFYQ